VSALSFYPALAAAVVALTTVAAQAESSGRFTMSPVDDGFVRLDKETGSMALCTKRGSGWSCLPMDDRQKALRDELDRLKAENTELKDEVRRLEETFVTGKPGDSGPGGGPQVGGPPGGLPPGGLPELKLPDEEDVDLAVDYLERMIRKFRERFEDFGDKTDPNRTPDGPPKSDDPPRDPTQL
jgi:hypothetical protein